MKKPNTNLVRRYLAVAKVVADVDPAALPIEFAAALLAIAVPYLNIAFLGGLLIALADHWATPALLSLLGGFLTARFVLTAGAAWGKKLAADHTELVNERLDAKTTSKLLTISYPDFQSASMREAYEGVRRGTAMNGGMTSLLENGFHDLFSVVIAAGFAVGVFVTLVRGHVRATALAAGLFNGPGYPLLMVGLLVVPLVIGAWAVRHANVRQAAMIQQIIRGNRAFTYFSSFVEDFLHGPLIRLYRADELILAIQRDATKASNDNYWYGQLGYLHYTLIPNIAVNLLVGVLYLLIGLQALGGGIAIGTVLVAVGYLQQFMTTVNAFISDVGWYNNMVDYLQYYSTFFALPDATQSGHLPVEKRTDNEFAIRFEDVSFKYPDSDTWALRHVTLTLHVGERLAVVGPNGSGKTTLIMLLCRLYRPTEGVITLNDINIDKYNEAEYQSLLGVVFQDFRLFAYSIAENVAASADYDEARVWEALAVADVKDRVAAMPRGLETPITQALDATGIDISGGEAQKIAIARAWYKDAPIVILDEPTAALDPLSEYAIYQRFDALIGAKTAVYISHRMSSTRFAQRIVVFDHGQLVQDGTHDTLMAAPGLYRDLFNAQAQYYTEDQVATERATASAAADTIAE
ncbi:ABC transporter ATP-binding protein [Lacticaseibacillus daqingensis]|uniref:ABC transporter ATP-binding protein n=1 Tax=Lacticaseibacillus daqingensis TaxID=2486014 RepID=UPI000F768547|nr:ABC transporter ATP-binding protein [Lacticaseibacillus daqingensis]